jgi:diacylglycerol kinase family enzyme
VDSREALNSPLPVILNKSSGSAEDREVEERLHHAFREHAGVEVDLQRAQDGADVLRLAEEASAGPSEVVVVGGGDGTVGSVASVLAGSEKVMGILPLGTLNHFAKDLEIPLDVEEAARNVVEGRVVRVDMGEVNGRMFVNNSSLGLYPSIVRDRKEQQQRLGRGKWPAFLWATLHALHRHRSILDLTLSVDGQELRRRTPFVFVGNNVYEMEGFDIGKRRHLDRGELSVYLAPGARPIDLVFITIRALFGGLRGADDFEVLRTTELRIDTRTGPVRVATDGEISMLNQPLQYRVRPKALRVVVPRETEGRKAS